MTRHFALCLALVSGLLLSLTSRSAQAAEPLTIAVSKGTVSLMVYVAAAKGLFTREGLNVQLVECSSGRECVQMLSQDKVDLATAADMAVVLGSAQRRDLAILATISASSHQIKLIARRSAGIVEPAQLAGKRVGTTAGTSAQYFLDSWLLFQNIQVGDVKVSSMPPPQLPQALAQREVDAVAIWEPVAGQALALLQGDSTVLPNPRVYTQHFNLVTTQAAQARRRPEMARVMRALAKAEESLRADPAEAQQVLAQRMGTDVAATGLAMKEHDYRLRLDQALVSTMSSQMRWAVQQQHVPAGSLPASPLELIAPALLSEARPDGVSFAR